MTAIGRGRADGGLEGRFLVLEGPDGCGKTTQAERLVAWLRAEGRRVEHVRDPGGTRLGEKIREILLDPAHEEIDPRTECFLFLASRAQLIAERIAPVLAAGGVVVSERWLHSTVCYQGYAGGLEPEEIWAAGEAASRGAVPDLSLVLDVDAAAGLARIGDAPDLMESRSIEFHRQVREGYRAIAATGRLNTRLIEAGSLDAVEREVRRAVRNVL